MAEEGRPLMSHTTVHTPAAHQGEHRKVQDCLLYHCCPVASPVTAHDTKTDTSYCQAPECLAARGPVAPTFTEGAMRRRVAFAFDSESLVTLDALLAQGHILRQVVVRHSVTGEARILTLPLAQEPKR